MDAVCCLFTSMQVCSMLEANEHIRNKHMSTLWLVVVEEIHCHSLLNDSVYIITVRFSNLKRMISVPAAAFSLKHEE